MEKDSHFAEFRFQKSELETVTEEEVKDVHKEESKHLQAPVSPASRQKPGFFNQRNKKGSLANAVSEKGGPVR